MHAVSEKRHSVNGKVIQFIPYTNADVFVHCPRCDMFVACTAVRAFHVFLDEIENHCVLAYSCVHVDMVYVAHYIAIHTYSEKLNKGYKLCDSQPPSPSNEYLMQSWRSHWKLKRKYKLFNLIDRSLLNARYDSTPPRQFVTARNSHFIAFYL